MAEISCHGSIAIINKITEILINNGLRQSEPGEFTKRALMNNKLGLLQAEAINDIVNAETVDQESNKILKNLRCLICQGQSVGDSNSEFAQTIKLVVNDQIKEGKSEKEIYAFLIEKYGEWIVYKPPFNKVNFLLWLFPYLVFVAGGAIIFLFLKKSNNH